MSDLHSIHFMVLMLYLCGLAISGGGWAFDSDPVMVIILFGMGIFSLVFFFASFLGVLGLTGVIVL